MKEFGYQRCEKLKAKKDLDLLFKKGHWIHSGRLRAIVLTKTEKNKVGVSVSKKYFKHAVDRNRIKRLLREAYRLDKSILKNRFPENIHIMLFWVSKDIPAKLSEVSEEYRKLFQS